MRPMPPGPMPTSSMMAGATASGTSLLSQPEPRLHDVRRIVNDLDGLFAR